MSGDGPTVRPATPADFAAVADLLNAAYGRIGTNLGETEDTTRERSEDALIIVIEILGTIAGTLTIAPAGSYYGRMARPGQMEVSRLAVSPAYQGHGIGTLMFQTVADHCSQQGISSFVGASLDNMKAAHRMYETAGAIPTKIPGVKARGYTLHLTSEQEN